MLGFFVVSGFLITRSREGVASISEFLWKRTLRIMPGFWICLLVTAMGFAPLAYYLDTGALTGFWTANGTSVLSHLVNNVFLKMRQYEVGTIWKDNSYPQVMNGSLWSLVYEFRCYLLIGALGFAAQWRHYRSMVLVSALAFWAAYILQDALPALDDFQHRRLPTYFLAGGAYYLFRDSIPCRRDLALVSLAVLVGALRFGSFRVFGPLLLPYVVLYVAFSLPSTKFDRSADISYGLYLYAFPIQQVLSQIGFTRFGPTAYMLAAWLLTIPVAALSYFVVEAPALKWKSFRARRPRLEPT